MVYVWAVLSGLSFAVAAVLQHREARAQPAELAMSLGLLNGLLRRPLWWLGGVADAGGLLFQATALGAGSIIAVEALRTTGLLFALALGAALGAGAMGLRQWLLAGVLVSGITGFMSVGNPVEGSHRPSALAWTVAASVTAVSVAAIVLGTRRSRGALRALGLGAATGLVWAFTAGLLKRVVDVFLHDGLSVVTSPALWALVAASLGGLLINQSSFQAGELSWSLPAMSVIEPVMASAFGIFLFHDRLSADSVFDGVVLVGSAVVALASVAVLAREEIDEPSPAGETPPVADSPGS